jgi:predicted nucleic acid-binding protein
MADLPRIYIETSIVSYLTARPSSDLVLAARQKLTRSWWSTQRQRYSLFISEFVTREAQLGDPAASAARLQALTGLIVLDVSPDVLLLGRDLIARGLLPRKAVFDALHIAVAAAHGMDYLLTWNCKHIANAAIRPGVEALCRSRGWEPPVLCTPDELWEGDL